jgi:deazaflavin-dependent oxidoreductase (nitroreductase family)
MVRRAGLLLGLIAGAFAAFATFVFVAIRTKSPPLLDAVRVFNRSFTNRLQRNSAGKPGAYAAVIRHQGRRSGRTFETPIVPFPVDGGFLVSLPYGPTADWVRNVLAQGSAVLTYEGRTVAVDRPEVVSSADVAHELPAGERRTHRLFRVEQCLRLHVAEPGSEPPEIR